MHLPVNELRILKTKANTIARKSFQNGTRDSIHVTIICIRMQYAHNTHITYTGYLKLKLRTTLIKIHIRDRPDKLQRIV